MNNNMNTEKRTYSIDYAVTVTLKPQLKRPARLMDSANYPKLLKALEHCQKTVIVELTKAGIPHYHCIAKVDMSKLKKYDNPVTHLRDSISKQGFGYIVLKPVSDYQGWVDYMQKEMHATSQTLMPVIIDDYKATGLQYIVNDLT